MNMKNEKKRVLIIDALNMYLRAYIVDPSLSRHGQPIGGLKGSLKILQKLVSTTKPDNIVIAWDGPDGSRKRKTIDKNYKQGRKPIRLNRAFHNLTDDEEIQIRFGTSRLIEYFNEMPIIQTMIEQVEADDVFRMCVACHTTKAGKNIVSNDKFYAALRRRNCLVAPYKG